MPRPADVVGQLRRRAGVGPHAQRRGVHYERGSAHYLRCEVVVVEASGRCRAAHGAGLHTHAAERGVDGQGCAAGAEHERAGRHGAPFKKVAERAGKRGSIGVVASQRTVGEHTHHIDGPHLDSRSIEAVQQRHHGLFVGDGDIETTQRRMGGKQGAEPAYIRELQIEIFRIDAVAGEFVGKIRLRERMAQHAAEQPVCLSSCHSDCKVSVFFRGITPPGRIN